VILEGLLAINTLDSGYPKVAVAMPATTKHTNKRGRESQRTHICIHERDRDTHVPAKLLLKQVEQLMYIDEIIHMADMKVMQLVHVLEQHRSIASRHELTKQTFSLEAGVLALLTLLLEKLALPLID